MKYPFSHWPGLSLVARRGWDVVDENGNFIVGWTGRKSRQQAWDYLMANYKGRRWMIRPVIVGGYKSYDPKILLTRAAYKWEHPLCEFAWEWRGPGALGFWSYP